jgi:sensor histidine kinase YesM
MQKAEENSTPFNNPLIRFLSSPRYRWLRHSLFIVVGLILAFKGDVGVYDDRSPEMRRAVLLADSISFVYVIGLIYVMLQIFVPKLLFRSKIFLFALSFFAITFIMFVGVFLIDHYILKPVNPGYMQHIEFNFIYFIQVGTVIAVLLASVIGLKVFKKWVNDVERMQELKQVNLKTELAQLKSQVNPHFLFNTLNNLTVLTKTDPDKATQVLYGLSDLLRYQLYDSAREQISLSKDIQFIQNLLNLEKIRKNDFSFTIHTEGNIDGQALPPFLFIPFVENAIKHGATTVGHSYLTLYFKVTGDELQFSSENSKPAVKQSTIGGLGLANIKRRLELLYPHNHTLEIKDDPDKYIVNLSLPL